MRLATAPIRAMAHAFTKNCGWLLIMSATVSLARGKHAVTYEGSVASRGVPALFEMAQVPEEVPDRPPAPLVWKAPGTEMLAAGWDAPRGLYGVVNVEGRAEQRTLDGTLANCCLSSQIRSEGRAYTTTWTGSLRAPVTGVYSMTLFSQGAISLKIDGRPHSHNRGNHDTHDESLIVDSAKAAAHALPHHDQTDGEQALKAHPDGGEQARKMRHPSQRRHKGNDVKAA